ATPTTAGDIGGENAIIKQTTAPTHLAGRMWLDTSVTPNILKRSTGSAWVNATPTTASEVGAEGSIVKQTTAPTHVVGKLWLDTSVTPNILKRSTGSAWVNATPTTASEVGAESTIYKQSTAPTHLVGRLWMDTSVTPNIMKRSDGTNWINLSPTQASHIGAYSTTEIDGKVVDANWYASAKSNGNLIKNIFGMTLPSTYAWLDNVTLPDGTRGRVVQKKFLANSAINNNGWLMDWIVVDPRKTYLLEFWVQAKDTNSRYYYGREEATDAGVANDAGNGPYIVAGRVPTAGDVGVWRKHYALIPPYYAGADLSHTTDQSSFTPDTEYKFWDANTAQIQIKTYLTYQPTATLDSEMYATGFGLYEVGSADGLYDSIASLDSKIEDKTDPTKIIETVIYAESFTSILSNKASVEDISDMATGTQVTGVKDTVTKYIDGRLDDEGGINEKINAVSASLTKTANDISAKFTSMGGINLVRNSIGYAGTDLWTISGTMNTLQNQELEQLGFGSGFYSALNTGGYIEQRIPTHVGETYSLSFWMKKSVDNATNGWAGIDVYENGVKKAFIGRGSAGGVTSGYELGLYTFSTQYSEITIRITVGSSADAIISGLMLNVGEDALQWQHANGEIYNTNVQMNLNGIKVINGQTQGYTIMSPQEFSGYALVEGTMQRVFTLNGDTTEVTKIDIDKEINMSPLKVIPIVSTASNGWAWIPSN
uniref:hypothetical protein n=1 Tax=Bacillus sp. UNC41MFS5 TaxID=1449046 RepID=UPI00047D3ECC